MEISRVSPSAILFKTKIGRLTLDKAGKILVEGGGESLTLAGPGEYEAYGFAIVGLENNRYLIEAEEIRVGVLPGGQLVVPAASADDLTAAEGLEPRREPKLVLSKLSLPEETEVVNLEVK